MNFFLNNNDPNTQNKIKCTLNVLYGIIVMYLIEKMNSMINLLKIEI